MTDFPRDIKREEAKSKFLEALAELGNVSAASKSAGIDRCTPYAWRKDDEAFATAWNDAMEIGAGALEDEAKRRAHDGWDEPVFQGGKHVGTVRKFSDTLLIFLLKGAMPKKYNDRMALTGPTGEGPVEFRVKSILEE